MVATPFLRDSFIHYSMPVYPDAIQPIMAAPVLSRPGVDALESASAGKDCLPHDAVQPVTQQTLSICYRHLIRQPVRSPSEWWAKQVRKKEVRIRRAVPLIVSFP